LHQDQGIAPLLAAVCGRR